MVRSYEMVPELAFRITIGISFGLASTTAAIRLLIRLKLNRRLFLDDAFLIFALVCLTAGTVLIYNLLDTLYFDETSTIDPASVHTPSFAVQNAIWYRKTKDAAASLMWTSLYCVKFSFLILFRRLVKRMKNMNLYLKMVIGVCVLSYLISICEVFIKCPYVDARVVSCGDRYGQTVAVEVVITTMDIVTDIMSIVTFALKLTAILSSPVIAVPLCLLWQVRIDGWQKWNVGVCLCLGIVDILIAMMRFAGLRLWNKYGVISTDYTWEAFWFYLETYMSVVVIAVTAFRSAIVSNAKRIREEKVRYKRSSREKLWTWHQKLSNRGNYNGLPSVPSATLTGMGTFVRGGSYSTIKRSYVEEPHMADEESIYGGLPAMSDQQRKVTRIVDMSARSVDAILDRQGLLYG